MKKEGNRKVVVISLGGSLIIPDNVNYRFLDHLKKTLKKYYRTHKFVLVCGGGSIARKYIEALAFEKQSEMQLSQAGIRATRMNALFVMQFFGKDANKTLPLNMEGVKHELVKNTVVICGALRYSPHSTSDTTAAKLAHFLSAEFINMTNVKGLYSADPRKDKNAKFIPLQTWKEFEKRALAIPYHSGQHFVLDQQAATLIREHHVPTYIVNQDLQNLGKFLAGKKFIGTTIAG